MGELIFLCVATVSLGFAFRAIRRDQGQRVSVRAISSVIYLVCLWVPAHLQASGAITSKLYKAGLTSAPTLDEIDRLCLQWAIELGVIALAEALIWAWRSKEAATTPKVAALINPRGTATLLIIIGALATILLQVPGLDERAAGGQGIPTLLRTSLLCGLAVIVYYRGFNDWKYKTVVAIGILWLFTQNIRSPLFVLFFAYIASELVHRRFSSKKRLTITVLIIIILAFGGALMSSLRANVVRDTGLSTQQVISQTFEDPLTAPFESGLDTLDGYRFSERLLPIVEPRPWDILNVVTTFVPRAIWPDKPSDLSVELSTSYLGYKGSGQYLSPAGYLSLVTGTWLGAVVGLALFTMLFAVLLRRFRSHFWSALILCTVFRFFLGGSSFDLYYGLTLVVPVLAVQTWLRSTWTPPPEIPVGAEAAGSTRRRTLTGPSQMSVVGASDAEGRSVF
ncbi:hypothetical protein ACHMXB_12315 [Arthrobacter sp. UC242_113]|uniref:hypothetical protein n=1 Tax=Arthrobacter sp. UC242_113 TaxID=3374550 RepID=UPI0037584862